MLISWNNNQRKDVLRQVLLQDRREYNIYLRRGPTPEGSGYVKMFEEWEVVERHTHLRRRDHREEKRNIRLLDISRNVEFRHS